jgi:competence protein ComGC
MKREIKNKPNSQLSRQRRNQWTLLELLAVLTIIAILISLMFPVFVQSRSITRNVVCKSNLKQLGIGYELMAANGFDANKDGVMNSLSGIDSFWSVTDMRRGDIMPEGWFIGMNSFLQIGRVNRQMTTNKKYYTCPEVQAPSNFDMDCISYNPNIYGSRNASSQECLKRSAIAEPSKSLFVVDGAQTNEAGAAYYGFTANKFNSFDLKPEFKNNRHPGKQKSPSVLNFINWDGSLGELPLARLRTGDVILKIK